VYVEELIVKASERRHGIGSALMENIERWACEVGARLITLDTHVDNAPARALYEAAGYRESATSW
jgi:ribosomal protein S18 acetylase RimI-like enzyme